MILYIMRHAEAVEGSDTLPDEWRYLTENGRAAARHTSSSLVRHASKPRLTITSPLTRAVQTAEIVIEKSGSKQVVIASTLLLPGGDNSKLITYLKGCRSARRVMLVGHEPQLGSLVVTLLGHGDGVISLKKGACVSLKLDTGPDAKPAVFLWYLVPGRKRTTSLKKAFPQR